MTYLHIKGIIVGKHKARISIHVEDRLNISVIGHKVNEFIHFLLYCRETLLCNRGFILCQVGLLHIYRQAVQIGLELIGLIVVCIKFKQVTEVLVNIHTVIGHSNLLCKHVAAHISTVHVKFYRYYVVCVCRTGHLPHLHGNGISHKRATLCIGKKHPALAFCKAKGFYLLVELQSIGFLGVTPRGISAPFYHHRIFEIIIYPIACYAEICLEI